jgi:hypothetical protein
MSTSPAKDGIDPLTGCTREVRAAETRSSLCPPPC